MGEEMLPQSQLAWWECELRDIAEQAKLDERKRVLEGLPEACEYDNMDESDTAFTAGQKNILMQVKELINETI